MEFFIMPYTHTTLQNPELLLRQSAAKGELATVQKILKHYLKHYKKSGNSIFNIDAPSESNGNTALHWASLKATTEKQDISIEYSQIINLLLAHGANYQLKNKQYATPYDLFKKDGRFLIPLNQAINKENSCRMSFLRSIIKMDYQKLNLDVDQKDVWQALSLSFYIFMEALNLIEFFPKKENERELTILSLACGFPAEIIPLSLYFQMHDIKVNYIGIDNAKNSIENNQTAFKQHKNLKFICADASDLSAVRAAIHPHTTIDFGILRNGDFTPSGGRQSIFSRIIDDVFPELIKPNYPLLLTVYSQRELETCFEKTSINAKFAKTRHGNYLEQVSNLYRIYRPGETHHIDCDKYMVILNAVPLTHVDQLTHVTHDMARIGF